MKKEYKAIAGTESKCRIRSMAVSVVLMVLCVAAMLLSVYSFSTENVVFGVSYIIAVILGLSYIVIKFNQFYSTYIAADDENIILKCWDNHFFPYNAWQGIPFIREFIPSRTQVVKIPMDEISMLMIGTKSYVKRNAEDESFNKEILPYEKHKYSNVTGMLDKANILYIRTYEDESCFMNISGFNPKDTMNVLNRFTRFCDESVEVKINARAFRRYLKRPEAEKTDNTEEKTE